MSRVRATGTRPERLVRRMLTDLGYRYRLHRKDLPGTPDIAFIGRRKAIFVHGCLWHDHDWRRGGRQPKTNAEYWRNKIARNRARDERDGAALAALGWSVLTLWECEVAHSETEARLTVFLSSPGPLKAATTVDRRGTTSNRDAGL